MGMLAIYAPLVAVFCYRSVIMYSREHIAPKPRTYTLALYGKFT